MPKTKKPSTWLEYIESAASKNYDAAQLNNGGLEKMFSLNQYDAAFYHSIPMIYLLDYTSGTYLTMSKSSSITLGYDPKEWLENGIGFTIDLYQKDDLKAFNEKIFPDRLEVLKNIPFEEHKNYIFAYNLRLKNGKGEYTNLLQRNCFVKSDPGGRPLLSLGMVLNVNYFKKENPVIQLVDRINPEDNSCETIYKKIYYLNEEDNIFSKREKEILLWLADGLITKEIAHKLFISDSTVINHRKKMLLKSGAKNVAELISFALKSNII